MQSIGQYEKGIYFDAGFLIAYNKKMNNKKWRCKICGYIHEGDEPPEICPRCGASKMNFNKVEEKENN
ncbi:MAG: Rubrerythrin [Candidatus Wolfebacteria bacterium GW2011_GWC1_37_10]|uniref:Rubrerythrin n=2 Tax=Candidatus Wolfeibacteriota TaxID=1752735 RepID=A0A0G0FR83_9BACT|nr:MAG: Rubrerythrin [Candidatus Wolfebacteria bacterium GW2011_GWC1_37_10]